MITGSKVTSNSITIVSLASPAAPIDKLRTSSNPAPFAPPLISVLELSAAAGITKLAIVPGAKNPLSGAKTSTSSVRLKSGRLVGPIFCTLIE